MGSVSESATLIISKNNNINTSYNIIVFENKNNISKLAILSLYTIMFFKQKSKLHRVRPKFGCIVLIDKHYSILKNSFKFGYNSDEIIENYFKKN